MPRTDQKVSFTEKPARIVEIGDTGHSQRVDNHLLRILKGVPRARVYRMIRSGEVRVNKGRVKPTTRLTKGDKLRVPPVKILETGEVPESAISKHAYLLNKVIYENEELLVLDKPSGLAVHAGSGIPYGLIELIRKIHSDGQALELCHRLDLETSGLIILSKKPYINKYINSLFKQKTDSNFGISKTYIALLAGPLEKQTEINHKLYRQGRRDGERIVVVNPKGDSARSTFRPTSRLGKFATLSEVDLHTGRTHQVRVHAQSMGHSVAGDKKYGDKRFNRKMGEMGLKRLFLHAYRLKFSLPDNHSIELEAPLSEDLEAMLETLRKMNI